MEILNQEEMGVEYYLPIARKQIRIEAQLNPDYLVLAMNNMTMPIPEKYTRPIAQPRGLVKPI